jgi:hypothetical protein
VTDASEELAGGLARSQRTVPQLWLATLGIGAGLTQSGVSAILLGTRIASPMEHDAVASALNDWFVEAGQDHPVRYWAEVAH